MAWLQINLESDRETAESLSELLELYGVLSVSLSALSDDPVFEDDAEKKQCLWSAVRVSALLHEDTDLDTLLVCLRNCVGPEKIIRHHIESVQDRDWVIDGQKNHAPKIFGDKLCICPSWCELPDSALPSLILDPGLAFGTGRHETTAMCLDWLTQQDVIGKQVIDYGCGSGILGLAALSLGAEQVIAVDNDPQALQACRINAANNRLTDKIRITRPDDIKIVSANMLLANILLNPLIDLAPRFAELVVTGGQIVLSGLLATQAEDCLVAYQSWFNMQLPRYTREWAMLSGTRNGVLIHREPE